MSTNAGTSAGSKCLPASRRRLSRARPRRQRGAVGAEGGQGVEAIGDGDDAGQQRDALAAQAVGVAAAVEALVVVADGGQDVAVADDRRQDALADHGMLADHSQISSADSAVGLVQDPLGQADLADVVQLGGEAEALEPARRRGRGAAQAAGRSARTRSEWPEVYGSRASSVRTRLSMAREEGRLELACLCGEACVRGGGGSCSLSRRSWYAAQRALQGVVELVEVDRLEEVVVGAGGQALRAGRPRPARR